MSQPVIAVSVYAVCLLFIIFERVDKAIIAISGALILILTRVLTLESALGYIEFETLLLLMGMMMIMYISQKSQIFAWFSVVMASLTKGNPFAVFVVFLLITAVFSAFFDNVTTILIVVPITIALTRGMGLNPKIFVISEIMFSNIGGALTLIGDASNIMIGTRAGLSFNSFIQNLYIPVLSSIVVVLGLLILLHWEVVKPIKRNFTKLFLSHLLINKIKHKFYRQVFQKKFIIVNLIILSCTVLAFVFHNTLHLKPGVVALFFAMILLMLTTKHVCLHETFNKVEWPTLFFFMGLFVLTGGLKEVGVLDQMSEWIISLSDDFTIRILLVLWGAGLVSMVVDNIPFVAVMIPVVTTLQQLDPGNPHNELLWWALSMGACFGGNGSLIGASANFVGVSIAKKEGLNITFFEYMKTALPLALVTLVLSSFYLIYRINY